MIWFFVLTLTFSDGSLDTAHSYMYPAQARCESARQAMVLAISQGQERNDRDGQITVSPACKRP